MSTHIRFVFSHPQFVVHTVFATSSKAVGARSILPAPDALHAEFKRIRADLDTWKIDETGVPLAELAKDNILRDAGQRLGIPDADLVVRAYREPSITCLSNTSYLEMVSEISKLVQQIQVKK